MKILGITGGTGTGKSTVTALLKKKGCEIIDADEISKRLEDKGTGVFDSIVKHFGAEILDGNGEIDRKRLAGIVFADKNERLILNKIVHGGVAEEIYKKVEILRRRGAEYAVLDVPIPVEKGFFDTADVIWAVCANDDLRVERLMKRSGLTEEEAESRIAAQLSNREYSELADAVIDNEGSLEDLEALVDYEFDRTVKSLQKG